jgi:hypothetical protein
MNAVDGKKMGIGTRVSNGYTANVWTVSEEVKLALFLGSTLVQEVPMIQGKFNLASVPAGQYTCVATSQQYYTFFDENCKVDANQELYKNIVMSPMLNPGTARIVLSWGPMPKDLDSYLNVPHQSTTVPACEINWRNKNCQSGVVRLDLDAVSGYGPETITLNGFRAGEYRYRVNHYRGGSVSGPILASQAVVALYTEEYTRYFKIGTDGFVDKDSWYVHVFGAYVCVFVCALPVYTAVLQDWNRWSCTNRSDMCTFFVFVCVPCPRVCV